MTETTTEDEARYLAAWAERYGARFEPEGECGFGRACVGVLMGDEYPAYRDYEPLDVAPYMRKIHECPEADPPDEVLDAYHKHDCLAVLGRGPDAVHQLYLWVRNLEREGIGIEVHTRRGHPIDILFHGSTSARLAKQHAEGVPGTATLTADEMREAGPGFEVRMPTTENSVPIPPKLSR